MRWWYAIGVFALLGCDDGPEVLVGPSPDGEVRDAFVRDAAQDRAVVDAAPQDMARPDRAVDRGPVDMAVDRAAPVDQAIPLDLAPVDAAPDMPPPPPVDQGAPAVPLCGGCMADGDCDDASACVPLFDGSRCLPVCNAQMPGACPPGFTCFGDRCLPAGARCDSCTLRGCPADQRCDPFSGGCVERTGRCGLCAADADCQPAFKCTQLGMTMHCLPDCGNGGACPDGLLCIGGTCAPLNGICDACGGCPLLSPVCNGFTGECVQCGLGVPCLPGFNCTFEGQCVPAPPPGACDSDLDCADDGALRRCGPAGRCVECLDGADCVAGTACVDGACAPGEACDGVACQLGALCGDGRCVDAAGELACAEDAACGEGRACNPLTGQCFRRDQRCDDAAVCAPGGACRPDPFDMNQTICTCAKQDPANGMEPNDQHRIPCQPGGVCLQFGGAPGACVPAQ